MRLPVAVDPHDYKLARLISRFKFGLPIINLYCQSLILNILSKKRHLKNTANSFRLSNQSFEGKFEACTSKDVTIFLQNRSQLVANFYDPERFRFKLLAARRRLYHNLSLSLFFSFSLSFSFFSLFLSLLVRLLGGWGGGGGGVTSVFSACPIKPCGGLKTCYHKSNN